VQYGPALTGRLGDMDNDVCYHALRTLNRLPPDDLAQISGAIVKLLRDEDVDIQLAALETLGTMEPQVLVPHFHAIKWSSIDCVGKTQSMAMKLLAKFEREAPRVVITVRPRFAHNASSCWIECTGMNGNTVLVVQLDSSTTCGELQAMVCEHLGLLSFQVELVLSDASILSRMVDTCLGDLLSPMEIISPCSAATNSVHSPLFMHAHVIVIDDSRRGYKSWVLFCSPNLPVAACLKRICSYDIALTLCMQGCNSFRFLEVDASVRGAGLEGNCIVWCPSLGTHLSRAARVYSSTVT